MAHISRALIEGVHYFKVNTAGVFTTFNGTQTQIRLLSGIFPNHLKHPHRRLIPNLLNECQDKKSLTQTEKSNEFKASKFKNIFRGDFSERAVLQVFKKLLTAYKTSLLTPSFEMDLKTFTNGNDFIKFCRILECKVHKFSLGTLLLLYDLEYFNVPQTNSLMKKISTLVLEKFNSGSPYDKLLIYGTTLSKPCEEKNRKNIIDQCEAYVKKSLDFDLQCNEFSFTIPELLKIEKLPKHVKLLLAEKLSDDILSLRVDKRLAMQAFHKLACREDDLLPKQKWLSLIKFYLEGNLTFSILKITSLAYTALLKKDISYYSPELIELMIKKLCGKTSICSVVHIGETLCAKGFFWREFLDTVINQLIFTSNCSEMPFLKSALSFLAQASFHEVVTESTAQSVINALKAKKIFEVISDLPNNSLWCMYLTYIGCDTKVLLSSIFKRANNETEARDSNLLTLHHLAKAYFPGEYESLSQKTVNSLVEDEFKKSGLWDPENSISKCFESEDFILRNCITSDMHCLHFVTVFQSDRKPMNLASYSKMSDSKIFFNVDTIKKPQGSKTVAFVFFPFDQPVRFLNLPSLTGCAKMYLKSFEGVNCDIVLLHKTFFSLSLEDKKKFLELQIDEIFEKSLKS